MKEREETSRVDSSLLPFVFQRGLSRPPPLARRSRSSLHGQLQFPRDTSCERKLRPCTAKLATTATPFQSPPRESPLPCRSSRCRHSIPRLSKPVSPPFLRCPERPPPPLPPPSFPL